jgi:hypothetical protein
MSWLTNLRLTGSFPAAAAVGCSSSERGVAKALEGRWRHRHICRQKESAAASLRPSKPPSQAAEHVERLPAAPAQQITSHCQHRSTAAAWPRTKSQYGTAGNGHRSLPQGNHWDCCCDHPAPVAYRLHNRNHGVVEELKVVSSQRHFKCGRRIRTTTRRLASRCDSKSMAPPRGTPDVHSLVSRSPGR